MFIYENKVAHGEEDTTKYDTLNIIVDATKQIPADDDKDVDVMVWADATNVYAKIGNNVISGTRHVAAE